MTLAGVRCQAIGQAAARPELGEDGVVFVHREDEVVDHGRELVEVEVLELEGIHDDDRFGFYAEGAMNHLRGVEPEQSLEESLSVLRRDLHHLGAENDQGSGDGNHEVFVLGLDLPHACRDRFERQIDLQ